MKLKNCFICTIASFVICICVSALASSNLNLSSQPLEIRINYEQLHMPDNIESLGIVGVHGIANINKYFYAGVGFYGSVKGQSGGYFGLSLDGGTQFPIFHNLWLDAGANIGGAGGRTTPVGGGFFIEPHAGLAYHFKYFYLEPYYSYIKFTDGQISSNQIGIQVSLPTLFTYANPNLSGTIISSSSAPIAMSSNYVGIIGQNYFPKKGIIDTGGQLNDNNFRLIGCEFGHLFNQYLLAFAQASGAFSGRSNGFADAVIGLGAELPLLVDQLKLIAKIGLGSGGGGAVDTGGGFIIHPTLGLELALNRFLALEANGGYIYAPKGDFQGATAGLVLKYYFENAEKSDIRGINIPDCLKYRKWRIRVFNETYFKPLSNYGSTNPDMQLINLNIDYFLNKNFYATGQASFAYKGEKTGGYFSGLLGPGLQFNIFRHTDIFGELLFGTAGGAGLDIGNGALIKPLAGINYQINPYWAIQASVGRLKALKGDFNSTVLNLGLSLSFDTLEKY